MSDSYDKVLKNVSDILNTYPPRSELTKDQFVIVFGDDFEFFYEYLKRNHPATNTSSNAVNRVLIPRVPEAENATFVFQNFQGERGSVTEELANKIYLKKTILAEPIQVKILIFLNPINYLAPEFDHVCRNCMGYVRCKDETKRHPCAIPRLYYPEAALPRFYLDFISEKLRFSTKDLSLQDWGLSTNARIAVRSFYTAFKVDVANFASKLCEYLAPNHTFVDATITELNASYTRLQITNSFRFKVEGDKPAKDYLYLPNNLEQVFQQSNVSFEAIEPDWSDIQQKNRDVDNLKYLHNQNELLSVLRVSRNFMSKVISKSHFQEDVDKLEEIDKIILSSHLTSKLVSSAFKEKVGLKFHDVSVKMIRAIAVDHAGEFANLLVNVETWMDANLTNSGSQNKISQFFVDFNKKFNKYFGLSNAYVINSWFYLNKNRVPHDWQQRLAGFDSDERYWVTPEYDLSMLDESFLEKKLEFSEFVDILRHFVRESFEFLIDMTEASRVPRNYKIKFYLHNERLNDIFRSFYDQENFTYFFDYWRWATVKYSVINSTQIDILHKKYLTSFSNGTIEFDQLNFQKNIKRPFLYVRDKFSFAGYEFLTNWQYPVYDIEHQYIFNQLQEQARPLYAKFKRDYIDRTVKRLINEESTTIDSTMKKIRTVLLQNFETNLYNWQETQPYARYVSLKYSMEYFEDYLRQLQLIFDTVNITVPEKEFGYLMGLKNKFEDLQLQANESLMFEQINTKWEWGRGFHIGQENSPNSSISTVSTGLNFLLLLVSVVVLKVRNMRWRF